MAVGTSRKKTKGDINAVEKTFRTFIKGNMGDICLEFKVWEWNTNQLYGLVMGMLHNCNAIKLLGLSFDDILNFVIDVDKGYSPLNPYHTFEHAVDVTFMLYHILYDLNGKRYLTDYEITAIFIASLCHDIGHPGLTNLYHINAKTETYRKFPHESVLEVQSCYLTNKLIDKHKLFRNLPASVQMCGVRTNVTDFIKNLISDAILATEMACHFSLVEDLTSLISEFDECSSPLPGDPNSRLFGILFKGKEHILKNYLNQTEVNNRRLFSKVLLHACDLSNTVRPFGICKKWSNAVVAEFFAQGDLEILKNIPVSPNMDRNKSDQVTISLQFGGIIVKPLFALLVELLPDSQVFLYQLTNNLKDWQNIRDNPHHIKEIQPCLSPGGFRRVSLPAGILDLPPDITDSLSELNSPFIPNRSYSHNKILGTWNKTRVVRNAGNNVYNRYSQPYSSTKMSNSNSDVSVVKRKVRRCSSLDISLIRINSDE